MKKSRILCRTIILNNNDSKVLLVRNKGEGYWYPPGGGWEDTDESLMYCANREVFEEVGINLSVKRLFYVQEFHHGEDQVFFEFFWLGRVDEDGVDFNHKDLDVNGKVEEFKWFSKHDLENIKVFPKILKDNFWIDIKNGSPDSVYLK